MGYKRSLDFLPSFFKTETNSKFLNATLDQLISEPELRKLDGYIGRKFAPSFTSDDSYIQEPNSLRQNYQLEPSTIYKDASGKIKLVSTYQDMLNRIESLGGIVGDNSRLFASKQYTYDGQFDYDKFANFSSYYWLPEGPDAVDIYSVPIDLEKSFDITPPRIYQVVNGEYEREPFDTTGFDVSSNAIARLREDGFKFSGYEGKVNPPIRLARGGTYTFNLDQSGHGFFIQTQPGLDLSESWQNNLSIREVFGVVNNGNDVGTVVFNVPLKDAQDFYLQLLSAGQVNLVAASKKKGRPLRYVEVQNKAYDELVTEHSGLDGQRFIDGKTVIFLPDPALEETPVSWEAYTSYLDNTLIRYGNTVYRAVTSFVSGRVFNTTNLEIYDAANDWYDPSLFDSEPFDSTNFDRGDDVDIEDRTGVFTVSITDDGYINLIPTSLIDLNYKVDVLEGIQYGNRQVMHNSEEKLELIPNITANYDFLYYQDSIDASINGIIELLDVTSLPDINVSTILGKETYTSPNGVDFTNGLKVKFRDATEPEEYSGKEFYVEGVGSSINLVPVEELISPEPWLDTLTTAFDTTVFDSGPFDAATSSPLAKDYIVINRAGRDRSAWSRGNRWFHQDVISATAEYNNYPPVLDFASRANRPIIEFNPDMQLFNFGRVAKLPVDLIDQSTTDAFSNVEGTTVEEVDGRISSYVIDGVALIDGLKIIFAADLDDNVRNKIYQVSWIRPQSSQDQRTATFTADGSSLGFDLNFDVTSVLNLEVQVDGVNANNAGYQWSIVDSQILTFDVAPPNNSNITATLVYKSQLHLELVDGDINDYDTVTIRDGIVNQGNQYYFLDGSWILGQNKSAVNQAPMFDLIDVDGVSLSDNTKYPSNTFVGNQIFGYQVSTTGTVDSELGFKLKHRTFNNVGDILFADYINKSTFNYRVGVESVQTSTAGTRIQHNLADGSIEYINQWTANEFKTQQYQTQTYFATQYQKNLFPLNVVPIDRTEPLDPTSILVYVNNRSINSNLYDIQLEGTQGYLLLDDDLVVGDKIDIKIASSTYNNKSVFEIPSSLEFNPMNVENSDFSLGQIRSHITKVYENTPGLRGDFIGQNNSRDLGNYKKYGGSIVQNLGSPHIANLFLNDPQANFVQSVQYAQKEYTRFKNKFTELLYSMPLTNPQNAILSVDEVIAEIGYNKSHMFPFFASDMLAHGTDYKTLTYTVTDTDVTTFDLTETFDDSVPSQTAITIYLNDVQLIKGLEYTFLAGQPVVQIIVEDTLDDLNHSTIVLAEGDVITIREYTTTDGSHVPPTPAKLGLGPLFRPGFVTDGNDTDPRTVLRGHDGSLTALFGDHRDDALLEFEKRIYNNIKVTYSGDLHDIRDYLPGGFKTTPYSKEEYDLILSSSFNTWLGQNGLRLSDHYTFDANDQWSWNYASTTSRVDGKKMPAAYWRGIYKYYFDTDAPHLRPWEMLGFTEEPDWWQYHYGPAPYTRGNSVLWSDLEEGIIVEGDRKGTDVRYARPGLINFVPVDEHGTMLSPFECLVKNYNSTDVSGNFIFGDGGPVETAWRQSSEYPFAMQIAMALMNPAEYFGANINKNTQVLKEFGAGNEQWVYSNTGLRHDSTQKVHGELDDKGNTVRVNGYVTWISEYAKSLGLDITSAVGDKLRGATVQFAYKMAGYSDKKYLRIYADQATPNSTNPSIIIPDEDFSIVINKSAPLLNITYSGVIITKTPDGYSVNGYDDNKPYFTVHPSSTTGRKEYIKVGNVSATKYLDGTNDTTQIPYGTEFTTPEHVVEFLVSYGRYLSDVGFLFIDKLDEDAAFYKDWDLAAREFLFYVQQGWEQDVAISISPVGSTIAYRAFNGVIDSLNDRVLGTRVLNEDFKILRNDEYSVFRQGRDFRLTTNNDRGIYLLDVDLVNYEHVIVFENRTRFNDVIYDPALGARQFRLKVTGFKTGDWDGSFGAAGFIINDDNIEDYQPGKNYYKGDIVKFKNAYYTASSDINGDVSFDLQSWIKSDYDKIAKGLLPNLANKAGKSSSFYDIDSVNLELDADRLGKGLIGLRPRTYLTNLQIDDTSQVKFYQGMITQKGSKNSLDKLLRARLNNFDGEVNFFEDWAIRTGQYGATDARQQLQLIVDENDAVRDPALLEILNENDDETAGRVSYKPGDIWLRPRVFDKDYLGVRTTGQVKGDLPNAGYVRLDDVEYTSPTVASLNTSVNLEEVKQGDQIALAINQANLWDVVRVDETGVSLTFMSVAPNGYATFEFDKAHNLKVDDLVLIKTVNNNPNISGFFVVYTVPTSNRITVKSSFTQLNGFKIAGALFKLVSQRFADASEIASREPLRGWQVNDKLFVDEASEDGWGVYEKQDAFEISNSFFPGDPNSLQATPATTVDAAFGTTLAVDKANTFMLVGQPGDESAISYSIVGNALQQDLYIVSPVAGAAGFGQEVGVSSTGIGVIAAPASDNIGYVHILKVNPVSGKYDFLQVIAPPDLDANGDFGSAIAVSDDGNWLAVGQPGVDGGYVYVYQYIATKVPPPVTQYFVGDGSNDAFTLTGVAANPESITSITVAVDGTTIDPSEYSLSVSTVTMSTAPASGADVVITVVRDRPEQEFTGDGSTDTFTLTGDSATPLNVYGLQIVVEGALKVPFVDYNLIGSNDVVFTTPPADGADIVIKQLDFYSLAGGFTGSGNVTGDRFGDNLYFTDDGKRLVVGAPKATASALNDAGKVYVYDRSYVEVVGDGSTETFEVDVQTLRSKVYVNEVLVEEDIGYDGDYELSSGDVVFATAPAAGDIIRIENNFLLETAILTGDAELEANLGSSVVMSTLDASLYAGSPYTEGTDNKVDTGSVTRWVNQGVRYGTITGTVSSPVLAHTGYLIINNRWVSLTSGATLSTVVDTINANAIPGVTASNSSNKLKLDANSLVVEHIDLSETVSGLLSDLGLEVYAQVQVISNPNNEEFGNFGKKLALSTDGETLVVASDRATSRVPTTFDFDVKETTFDNEATNFVFDSTQSGAVFTYQLLEKVNETVDSPGSFIPAQKLVNTSVDPLDQFGADVTISQTTIYVGVPGDDTYASNGGAVFSFEVGDYEQAWTLIRSETPKVNHNLINRISLIDTKLNKIVTDLDFIDPYKGKISGVAAEEINYRTSYDPAIYNVSVDNKTITPTGVLWGKNQVGQVWWNTNATRWLEYEQGDLDFRLANWGTAFPESTILCYEWIESDAPPAQYKDINNPLSYVVSQAHSRVEYVDPAGAIQVKYYFWVAARETVPHIPTRKLSTVQLEKIIANPKAEGVPFVAFIAPNAIALYNCKKYLRGSDIVLSIDYDVIENENNIHAEYQLVSEGDASSKPTEDVITKLIDSLAGSDLDGRLVPDIALTPGRKYGKEFRPRQTMFRDRIEALKVAVDFMNSKLALSPVLLSRNVENLLASEPQPTEASLEWNEKVQNSTELGYLNKATIPVGYRVLVESDDEVQDRWTIYSLALEDDGVTRYWSLYRVQSYRNIDFIEYVDWVKDGVTLAPITDFVVDFTYQASELGELEDGATVKIKDDGRGLYTIVRYDATTASWETVALERATVKISDGIWDQTATLQGFDMESFDLQLFDSWSNIEIQNILRAVYEDIFVDDLEIEANRWFFMMMQHLLQEQKYVDWIFKSSFIKVEQRQETIKQVVAYQLDNQELLREYINETKPYHTKIREYILKYDGSETADADTTDFDVPAYYISESGRYRSPNGTETIDDFILDLTAYRPWRDNHTFVLDSIEVYDAGSGYVVAPEIEISGGGGTGATAEADILNGVIIGVRVTNEGVGYTTTPTVTAISGSGTGAVLVPRLSNNKVRRVSSTLKFDRVSTRFSSFLVQFIDGNGDPVDVREEKISRVTGQAGVIDLLLDTLSGGLWLVDTEDDAGYPVNVPNYYAFDDASGRVIVEYTRTPNGFSEYDLTVALRALSGGVNALDLDGTVVTVDDSVVNYQSIVKEWAANTQYTPGDIITHNGVAYTAMNRFSSTSTFEDDPVAVEIEANTDEYVFNIGGAGAWEALTTYNPGLYYVDPDNTSRLYRVMKDFISGLTMSADSLLVMEGGDFESHLDRTWAYYNPTSGMFGKDLSQLFSGVSYPGVNIIGPRFDEEPGFDVAPYDTEPFDRFIIGPEGLKVLDPATLDQTIQSSFTDTLLGTRPEDIIVYGNGFLDPYLSHAPEEMVPGAVFDTLDLKVYSTPSNDWLDEGIGFDIVLTTKSFDSSIAEYAFDVPDGTLDSITVFSVQTGRLVKEEDYTVDWINHTIMVSKPLLDTDKLFIYAFSQGGPGLQYAYQYVTNGTQTEWNIPVDEDLIDQVFVLLNGDNASGDFTVDGDTIVFTTAPAADQLMTVHVFSSEDEQQKFSDVSTDTYIVGADIYPTNSTFTVTGEIGYSFPYTEKIIVEVNGSRLRPPNQAYYTGDGSTLVFALPDTVYVDPDDIVDSLVRVAIDGEQSQVYVGWELSPSDGSTMQNVVFVTPPAEGSEITISLIKDADYSVVDANTVLISEAVGLAEDDRVLIQKYTSHDALKIRTQVFKGTTTDSATVTIGYDDTPFDSEMFDGDTTVISTVTRYTLSRPVTKTDYLRVTLDLEGAHGGGRYLFPNIDYTLISPTVIEIGAALGITPDSILVVTSFYEVGQKPSIGFRIFNDMRGDVYYTRLADSATTLLARDLETKDDTIYVVDASVLGEPSLDRNEPGVVFIDGERITYYARDTVTNTLTQIRRGSGGTALSPHYAGASVVDSGTSQTIVEANDAVWYDNGDGTATDGEGLQNSTTKQARFLLEGQVTPPVFTG